MIIDVTIKYYNAQLEIDSIIGNYHVVETANVTMTRENHTAPEKIGAVGMTKLEVDQRARELAAELKPGFSYRFVDPFNSLVINAGLAGKIIAFYCLKLHLMMIQHWSTLRRLFRIDRFQVTLQIPGINNLASDQQRELIKSIKEMLPVKEIILIG